jgi:hypothetical protein
MTAFKLKRKESEDEGIRRVAHGRAEDAVDVSEAPVLAPVGILAEARADELQVARSFFMSLRASCTASTGSASSSRSSSALLRRATAGRLVGRPRAARR